MDELNLIFGDEAPSSSSVYRWYGEFNRGLSSLQGEFREGRLKSVVVPETIDAKRQLILQDCHVTYREIVRKKFSFLRVCLKTIHPLRTIVL